MLKKIYISVITLFLFGGAIGQSCLPEGIYFTTQSQIDSFQINYPNCTEIEGDVTIDGNIDNLNGLSVINHIGGYLWIWACPLIDLSGLDNLTTIGGKLEIWDNNALTSLTGLENLVSIGGNLHIGYWEFDAGNPSLTSLEALNNLTSIGGILEVANNPSLTSLVGLDNIDANSITELYIYNNTSLPACDIQNVCAYLSSPNGSINIYNNAIGCNNPVEVTNACGITFDCLPYGNYYFVTQDEIDNFQINYTGCFDLKGNVRITGWDEINNLSGLSSINSIEGNLQIYGTGALTNFSGLEGLNNIGGTLLIGDYNLGSNEALINFNGLENLVSIGGNLVIDRNPLLASFYGLEGLSSIGDWFWLGHNPSLTSISSLSNLTSIGGSLLINPDWPINSSLASLTGMENITSIGGYLWIENMGALTSLNGLENLTSIEGYLKIAGNDSLISLDGLDNIDAASIESLMIWANSSLSTCEIQSVCDYIATPNADVSINQNASGCQTLAEVEEACESVKINEINIGKLISTYPNPSHSTITIELPAQPSKNTILTISSTSGQQLITQPITKPQTEIDISHLPVGIYIVKVWNENEVMVRKVIKQ